MRSVAAAIIAGGPARRLGGATKPLLEIGGQAVADRQLAVLRPLFPRLLVVANEPAPWRARGVEVVADRVAGAGPLAGLSAALAAAGDAEAVVCLAGDLPFLSPARCPRPTPSPRVQEGGQSRSALATPSGRAPSSTPASLMDGLRCMIS
jgi:molybdenum cofactor guanylyltransferase